MSFRIGDPVFGTNGAPGIVSSEESISEKIKIDTDEKAIATQFRHGYLKGLTPESREELYKVLDEISQIKDPKEKIAVLQEKVETMEMDERPLAQQLLGYYKAELSHVINSYHMQPRFHRTPIYRL